MAPSKAQKIATIAPARLHQYCHEIVKPKLWLWGYGGFFLSLTMSGSGDVLSFIVMHVTDSYFVSSPMSEPFLWNHLHTMCNVLFLSDTNAVVLKLISPFAFTMTSAIRSQTNSAVFYKEEKPTDVMVKLRILIMVHVLCYLLCLHPWQPPPPLTHSILHTTGM